MPQLQWNHELKRNDDDTYIPYGAFYALFATYCHGVLLRKPAGESILKGGGSILNHLRNWKEMCWKSALSLDSAKTKEKKKSSWLIYNMR